MQLNGALGASAAPLCLAIRLSSHRKMIFSSGWLIDPDKPQYKLKRFNNTSAGRRDLAMWVNVLVIGEAEEAAGIHLAMEATGEYRRPSTHALFEAGLRVSVVNPVEPKKLPEAWVIRTKHPSKIVLLWPCLVTTPNP